MATQDSVRSQTLLHYANGQPKYFYEVRDVPGKGYGLIAINDLDKGTRIISEWPTVELRDHNQDEQFVKTSIAHQLESRTEKERKAFYALSNRFPYQNVEEQALGICKSNQLPTISTDTPSQKFKAGGLSRII